MKLEKLGTRLSLQFLLMILVMIAAIYGIISLITQNAVDVMLTDQAITANHSVQLFVREYQETALIRAKIIASSGNVADAVASGNAQEILKALTPYTEDLDLVTVCDARGIVLARTHSDTKGDDVSNQTALLTALNTGSGIGTVETGTAVNLATQGSAAIKNAEGKIIGAIAVGHDLAKREYVDRIKDMNGCEVTLFYGDMRLNTTLTDETGNRIINTKANSNVVQKVINERQTYSGPLTLVGQPYQVCYTPLEVSGKVVGMVFSGVHDNGLTAQLADASLTIAAAAILLTIVFSLAARLMIRQTLIRPLNSTMATIDTAAIRVSSGAKQIADNAQALSQGATEQAASVEQITSSITEVRAQMRENIERTESAVELSETIKSNAEVGEHQMDRMTQAVRDIEDASQSIIKVIKIIDDIAFQTNILALNAAVEAARAGDEGRGFSVVAEEVRSLAAKSQQAAKNTEALIEDSNTKAVLGAQIARETAESLKKIISGVNESSLVIHDIASSSSEQGNTIDQISNAADAVTEIIQQNLSATENAAAASEEMNGLALELQSMIDEFELSEEELARSATRATNTLGEGKSPLQRLPRGRFASR